jgi:hypothetical protein
MLSGAGGLALAAQAGAKAPKATTTTTTTTSTTTTTTTAPTTTTTAVPCTAAPTSVTGPPQMTVTPGTCLNGGTVVTVTGSGFDDSSLGIILQCNSDASQPTVTMSVLGTPETLPVSCSSLALSRAISTSSTGSIPAPGKTATFTILSPTSGPPCGEPGDLVATCPADSTGGNTATDAASYPCPPTPAQLTAGDTCQLIYADQGGKMATVPISFVPAPTPSAPGASTAGSTTGSSTTGSSTTAGTTAAGTTAAATTAPSTGALAFTGSGPDTWYTLLAALVMLSLGFLLLSVYYRPRELAAKIRHGVGRTIGVRE